MRVRRRPPGQWRSGERNEARSSGRKAVHLARVSLRVDDRAARRAARRCRRRRRGCASADGERGRVADRRRSGTARAAACPSTSTPPSSPSTNAVRRDDPHRAGRRRRPAASTGPRAGPPRRRRPAAPRARRAARRRLISPSGSVMSAHARPARRRRCRPGRRAAARGGGPRRARPAVRPVPLVSSRWRLLERGDLLRAAGRCGWRGRPGSGPGPPAGRRRAARPPAWSAPARRRRSPSTREQHGHRDVDPAQPRRAAAGRSDRRSARRLGHARKTRRRIAAALVKIRMPSTTTTPVDSCPPTPSWSPRKTTSAGDEDVAHERHDEDPVVEDPVELGPDRAEHRVERGDDGDRQVGLQRRRARSARAPARARRPTTRARAGITSVPPAGRRGAQVGGAGRRAASAASARRDVEPEAVQRRRRWPAAGRSGRRRSRPPARSASPTARTTYGGLSGRQSTRIASPALRIGGQRGEPLAVDADRLGAGGPQPVDDVLQVAVLHPALGHVPPRSGSAPSASPVGASSSVTTTPGPAHRRWSRWPAPSAASRSARGPAGRVGAERPARGRRSTSSRSRSAAAGELVALARCARATSAASSAAQPLRRPAWRSRTCGDGRAGDDADGERARPAARRPRPSPAAGGGRPAAPALLARAARSAYASSRRVRPSCRRAATSTRRPGAAAARPRAGGGGRSSRPHPAAQRAGPRAAHGAVASTTSAHSVSRSAACAGVAPLGPHVGDRLRRVGQHERPAAVGLDDAHAVGRVDLAAAGGLARRCA